ncbi:MAG: chemotaxis protein CheX [Desulfobacterota bacterium]|nr:chemotaxis protein CheX [Thermodesulfobacteriota bacterium]
MLQPHLKEAISRVMETMFFMPVQFGDGTHSLGEWFSREPTVREALIDFQGARSGRGFLLVPVQGLKEMAANFLGLREAEVDEEQMQDTLREAVNMMMGQMLSLWDRKGGCALGIPRFTGERILREVQAQNNPAVLFLFETEKTHLAAGVIEP